LKRLDLLFALAIATLGAILGVLVLFQGRTVFFYQSFTPEIVYFACGHGLSHPGTVPPRLLAFLARESATFNCADLDPVGNPGPPGLFVLMQIYFSWIVAFIWSVSSISYRNLWPLVGLLSGLYCGGCFVLLRQFFGRISAVLGSCFLALSPAALPLIFLLRDYGKAPFFIWSIIFLIQALRVQRLKAMLLWVAASAAMVGIGCGFRADLIILLPLGMISLLLVFDIKLFVKRALAAGLFMVVVLFSAFPILSAGKSGTYGSLIIEGMSDPFRSYLQLGPTPYSFGAAYSDELVLSSVAADEAPERPDWNAHEGQPVYGVSQATELSGQNWQRFFPFFPADFVVQAFKSASWIIGFPALAAVDRPPDPGYPVMTGPPVSVVMKPIYVILAHHWMPWLGMVGLTVFFWRIWSRSKSEAIALAFLFGALLTYPVVQFSIRHVFHLEFIWLMAMLALLELPLVIRSLRQNAISYCILVIGVGIVGFSAYLILVRYQQSQLIAQFETLLSAERQTVAQISGPAGGELTHVALPVPPAYEALLRASPDSMTPKIAGIGIQWDVRSEADRVLLSFSGPGCNDKIKVVSNYTKTNDVWQPMDQTFGMLANQPADGAILLVPAFYRATQHLSSFDISGISTSCSVKVERIVGKTAFPALLRMAFPPNWRNLPLHAGFGRF